MRLDFGDTWVPVIDGDPAARALFDRHYSRRRNSATKKFIGPGQYLCLLTPKGDALCVWRKFLSMDAQTGVNCAIYRNESPVLSSELLKSAMAAAWAKWPGERLYTYVNPRKIRSRNPGFCFKMAGWRYCGLTKARKLHILEVLPPAGIRDAVTLPKSP